MLQAVQLAPLPAQRRLEHWLSDEVIDALLEPFCLAPWTVPRTSARSQDRPPQVPHTHLVKLVSTLSL